MENRTYAADDIVRRSGATLLGLSERSQKRHRPVQSIAWEQAEFEMNSLYAKHLHEIVNRYPALTLMEMRVCALVKAMLPSWRIAEILGVSEHTIENHRSNARRKMCLNGVSLARHLAKL